jgi:hypothetical protein
MTSLCTSQPPAHHRLISGREFAHSGNDPNEIVLIGFGLPAAGCKGAPTAASDGLLWGNGSFRSDALREQSGVLVIRTA